MKKSTALFAVLAALLLPASCSLFMSTADTGTLTVNFGPAAQSRALADAPDFFPRFGEVTLTVSGPGMDPVTTTVDSASLMASLAIPAGNDRRVELYAVPDWDATAAAFPALATLMPTLVKAYGATAEVDISAGRSTEVALKLSAAETKILLPDAASSGNLGYADSIGSAITGPFLLEYGIENSIYLDSTTFFAFDRFGYLYFNNSDGIHRTSALSVGSPLPEGTVLPEIYSGTTECISMDSKNNRI